MPYDVTDPPPVEQLPTDFGSYRLEKRIATGGIAETLLGYHRDEPARPVVIKRILPQLGNNGEFVQVFLDTARTACQLRHTNIVTVEDIGQVDGTCFLAMEFLHGENVRRIYNRAYRLQRSLPLSHSIRVLADAALGLGYGHKLADTSGHPLKMVHQEISPQNILVTYEGDAKIGDFGIAKAIGQVAESRAVALKAKYSYMSPEQALGEDVDHRTDIFALGIILYETTTGTRLFKQNNELATLQAIIKCRIVPPSEALQNYPARLEEIVLKALAKDRDDRFDDADDLSAALYDFLYESKLYVEREEIAAFMKDLFSDDSEDKEDDRSPLLPPSPEENPLKPAKSDTEKSPGERPPRGGNIHISGEVPASAGRGGLFLDGPGGESNDRAHDAGDPPERRRSTYVVAPGADRNQERKTLAELDNAPTVAVPSYASDTSPGVSEPSVNPIADSPFTPRPLKEQEPKQTLERKEEREHGPERERAQRQMPIWSPLHQAAWLRERDLARRPAWVAGAVGLALLVATLTGILVFRSQRTRVPETPMLEPPPPVEIARVTVVTEPGAEVFAQGELLGTADASGSAGPYPVTPGEVLVRVRHSGRGFERQRPLSIQAGHNYHFEILGRQGFLSIAVAPWARVRIDGRDMGLTPLPRLSLIEGVHKVELINPDIRLRHQGVVRILAGEVSVLKVNLRESGEGL